MLLNLTLWPGSLCLDCKMTARGSHSEASPRWRNTLFFQIHFFPHTLSHRHVRVCVFQLINEDKPWSDEAAGKLLITAYYGTRCSVFSHPLLSSGVSDRQDCPTANIFVSPNAKPFCVQDIFTFHFSQITAVLRFLGLRFNSWLKY